MVSSALRMLDANLNRAREGLRVLEDYARFVLNDDRLCARLKQMRHDLVACAPDLAAEAIVHRDTPGDVGTDNRTLSEAHRADLADVVIAAGKRLGEALRVIEEVLKTKSPVEAQKIESIRYQGYDVEQIIARTLHPAKHFAHVRLYVLITESICSGPWLQTAEAAILGGADCIQLREKEMESGELLDRSRQLVELCRGHGTLCIINDRPDIALLSGAHGIHVGQSDLPAAEVRKLIGRQMILGVSTHNVGQAKQAVLDGVDYVGVGPVFASKTKPRDFLPGLEYARQAAQAVTIPTVAIAGITVDNVDKVIETGVGAVAVSSAVVSQPDVRRAAAALKSRLEAQAPAV